MKLKKSIKSYSKANGYLATEFTNIICKCALKQFELITDDQEEGAYVECSSCNLKIDIENSMQYMSRKTQNICTCDCKLFTICIGKAFYDNSNDPRWIYIGAECLKCGLGGVYIDWHER